jgi:Peptidase A4 family
MNSIKATLRVGILASILVLSAFMSLSIASPLVSSGSATANNTSAFSILKSHPNIEDVTPTASINWAGYAINSTPGSVSAVTGSWTVPSVTCNPSLNFWQYAAFWVGIDGFSSQTVEQDGVFAFCTPSHAGVTAHYNAWYEAYPEPSVTIKHFAVSPGDVIDAGVKYTGHSNFELWITDATTKQSFAITQSVPQAQRSSAEWITEEPAFCSGKCHSIRFAYLADYTSASFGTGVMNTATINGHTWAIGKWGANVFVITCVTYPSGTYVMDTPSPLGSDQSSFRMAWVSPGPAPRIKL